MAFLRGSTWEFANSCRPPPKRTKPGLSLSGSGVAAMSSCLPSGDEVRVRASMSDSGSLEAYLGRS